MAVVEQPGGLLAAMWRPLRLETLVTLRWLAVGGQTMGVLFVQYGLGFPLPLLECLSLIALLAGINLTLLLRFGTAYRPSNRFATAQLAIDSLELGGILALTGGLHNPFALLFLAPVSVSATILPQRSTAILAVLIAVIASVIAVFHLPLPWDPDVDLVFDRLYEVGIWASLLCAVVLIAAYTNRVAREARQLADALAATEVALSRHEQLSALDGLAAAAAHELGTPLSTIALAAAEMRDELPPGPLADDIELIISQSNRCRAILAKLRNLGHDGGDPFASAPLGELLAEVAKPHEGLGKAIEIVSAGHGPDPVFRRNVGLAYGLGNLIENACHFASSRVMVDASWDERRITVAITDDGPGFPPDLMTRLGDPYLTSRARTLQAGREGETAGLGLGIFIAKTLLERTGAEIAFNNATAEGHAMVKVVWSRETVRAGGLLL
ncbi:MAG TPA: ActS/PrrB/RegB family redox-sensitive histidine kinase [Devosiaceae bacterium]|nr:ActS/PrrB/RegB family redox-sensitive histidine kinase [Devosiaceae bacterium]